MNEEEVKAYEAHQERYWQQIQTTVPFEINPGERHQLRSLLFSPILMKALNKAFNATHLGVEMLSANLETQEGVVQAARKQGEAKGMVKLLERLFEEAYKEND